MALLAALLLAGGCTTGYWADRAHDAADVVTATVGMGGGAFVQVGPKPVGWGFIVDEWGLEDGKVGSIPCLTAFQGVAERFAVCEPDDVRVRRGKLPAVLDDGRVAVLPHHWTQVRLFAGVTVLSASTVVNLGELADFVLGWSGLDIYGDDAEGRVAAAREQEEDR